MRFTTSDLCDAYPNKVQIADPVFRDYGALVSFRGPIQTLRVFEDNALVRQVIDTAGEGRVLVVDGGGSLRCALVGGQLASLAEANGWSGLVINGCVRDSVELRELAIGIRALGAVPRRSPKEGRGERGISVSFAGVNFAPGGFVYADADGLVVSGDDLLA
jgi:regulator of ribonuclease activity A